MNQREFVQSLSTQQRKQLTQKTNWQACLRLAIHFGGVALLGYLITQRVSYWPVLMLPQGILLVFLFTLQHECIHQTAFASRQVNALVAWICGLVIVLAPRWFRYFHFAHHRHTQNPDKDPELLVAKPDTGWQYLKHLSGVPVAISLARTLLTHARGRCTDEFVPVAQRPRLYAEARIMLLVYAALLAASLLLGSAELLFVWIIPLVLGQPFLRCYLLAEHGGCSFVSSVFDNTRTTLSNRAVRWLAWNMPYHAEHHAYPAVPFHQLAHLHDLMRDQLTELETGYWRFNRQYVQKFASRHSSRHSSGHSSGQSNGQCSDDSSSIG